jgi:Ca-activated chloride channel family protein
MRVVAGETASNQPLPFDRQSMVELNTERYTHRDPNGVHLVAEEPLSTFSIDVDTASYANARRFLTAGTLPAPDAVRTEEFLNYFDYGYAPPADREAPFAVHTELAPAPWNPARTLLRIGIKGYEVPHAKLPPANLVFLLDVSGSMDEPAKLPLLKNAMRMLSHQMRPEDRVSIVVYAGAAGLVLEPTPGDRQAEIDAAIERLSAGGSTNGGEGIRLAYDVARRAFRADGINRVILATDGDFNVGTTGLDDLKHLVEERRAAGISLTTLGFGRGNFNDALMNELAEIGDGNSAYIDTALEARKVLVDQLGGTLMTIAKDVKIQVEFSPRVAEYRLIGYESRMLAREDFNNDAKDAGEIGAGHSVTALYELTLAGSGAPAIDPPRYAHPASDSSAGPVHADELAFVKLRYKRPDEARSRLLTRVVRAADADASLSGSSEDFRFAAAVAAFGQRLARNPQLGNYGYADLIRLAEGARGRDAHGYREEFLRLARMAESLEMAAPVVAGN